MATIALPWDQSKYEIVNGMSFGYNAIQTVDKVNEFTNLTTQFSDRLGANKYDLPQI